MRRYLAIAGFLLILLSVLIVNYSAQTGSIRVYKYSNGSFQPMDVNYVDRGTEYDVHRDPNSNYNWYDDFYAFQLERTIDYVAVYRGYQCLGDLYITYKFGSKSSTTPAGQGDLAWSNLGGSSGSYSIHNNCSWHSQTIVYWTRYAAPVTSDGFGYPFGTLEYYAIPKDPDNNKPTWNVCISVHIPGEDPAYDCFDAYQPWAVLEYGWFYDFKNKKYGIFYHGSSAVDPATYERDRVAEPGMYVDLNVQGGSERFYMGPCGLTVYNDGSCYRILTHVGSDGSFEYDKSVCIKYVQGYTFFLDPEDNRWYCYFNQDYQGYYLYPSGDHWVMKKAPFYAPLGNGYGYVRFDDNYYYFRDDYTSFTYFGDSDGDGVPDIWKLEGYYDHRYEIDPVQGVSIKWYTVPSFPRGQEYGDLNFSLDVNFWPGTSYTLKSFSLSVDGNELNTDGKSLDSVFTYGFSHGDHQICYSFTIVDGSDTDSYSGCFNVHIGYIPWGVSFTATQKGRKVTFVATALDDGRIVDYEWNIDGDVLSEHLPVVATYLSPGKHDVCLTVTDNDGIKVRYCSVVDVKYTKVYAHSGETKVVVPVSTVLSPRTLSVVFISPRMVLVSLGMILLIISVII